MATDTIVGPQTVRTPSRIASLVVLVLDILGLLCLLFVTTVGATRFREIFADLQVPLPVMTAAVLSVPWFAYALLIGAAIAGLIAKERSVADRRQTRNINLIAMGVIVLCLMLFVFAMFSPLGVIISTMETQAPAR